MRFDFIEDFRTRPTVRNDSWITIPPGDISGSLVVRDTATLYVQDSLAITNLMHVHAGARVALDSTDLGVPVTFASGSDLIFGPGSEGYRSKLWVGEGTTLTMDGGSAIEMGAYGFLEVAGTMTLDTTSVTFTGDCAEIVARDGGTVNLDIEFVLDNDCACVASDGSGLVSFGPGRTLTISDGAFFASMNGGDYALGTGGLIDITATADVAIVEPGATFDFGSGARIRLHRDDAWWGLPGDPVAFTGGAVEVADGTFALGDATLTGTALRVEPGAGAIRYATTGTLTLGPGLKVEKGGTLRAYVGAPPPEAAAAAALRTQPASATYSAAPPETLAAMAGAPASVGASAAPAPPPTPPASAEPLGKTSEPGALVFGLEAYPNPFAQRATLRFILPEAAAARLVVYDALGREVVRLVEADLAAGTHTATLDGTRLPSGAYLYRLSAGSHAATGTLLLAR